MNWRGKFRMFAIGCTAFSGVALLGGCATTHTQDPTERPEDRVKEVHQEYWDRMAAHDASGAFRLLTSESKDWLDDLAKKMIVADRDQILSMSPTELETILIARSEICSSGFKRSTGKGLFKLAVNQGLLLPLVYDDFFPDISTLHSIRVDEPRATATPSDRPSFDLWHYSLEGDKWKIDLLGAFENIDSVTADAAARKGIPLSDYALGKVEESLDRPIPSHAWSSFKACHVR